LLSIVVEGCEIEEERFCRGGDGGISISGIE